MPSGRNLGCTCGLSHVRPLRWRCVAVQEWQHPAEDLWSLHLEGKVASVVAQSYSEVSTEPTQAAAVLSRGMDDAEWVGVASL